MNREEQIAMFRSNILPKYVKMAAEMKDLRYKSEQLEVRYVTQPKYKYCEKCGKWLPRSEFYTDYRKYCKKCEKLIRIEKKNPQ